MESLPIESILDQLKQAKFILSTVESCTGGLLAHLITDVPGASSVYWGSTVAYDNSLKEQLGVSKHTLTSEGAVSAAVAKELAECGIASMQKAVTQSPSYALPTARGSICLATTGIAGPTGGTDTKPVGLCFIGLAISGGPTLIHEVRNPTHWDRATHKNAFAQEALRFLQQSLSHLKTL